MTEHRFQAVVGPFLQPGEHIEAAAVGNMGKPSATRKIATTVAVSALTLGTFTATVHGRSAAFVLTNQRLLIFDTNANATKPVAKLLGETDRAGLTAVPARSLVTLKLDVISPDGSEFRLTFPAMQKRAGKVLADAIAASPTA